MAIRTAIWPPEFVAGFFGNSAKDLPKSRRAADIPAAQFLL
jgi:hypothetical protein